MNLRALLRCAWRSYCLLRAFGVPVRLHTTTLIWPFGLISWWGWNESGVRGLIESGAWLLLLYGSLLVHEFAHVLVARRFGVNTSQVLMLPFGCMAELEDIPREPDEVWIAIAGPAASLALACLAAGVSTMLQDPPPFSDLNAQDIVTLASYVNLTLGLFNLLPCFPMDGGRILRSLIAIGIGLFAPRYAGDAFLVATRIAVRYLARPIAIGAVVLAIAYTHIWIHILLFAFLVLAGEVEFLVLRESPRFLPVPMELALLPVSRSVARARKVRPSDVAPFALFERKSNTGAPRLCPL